VLRALLLAGADVDAKDADGRSVLYILALENHLPMARFLLEQGGANVESRDSEASLYRKLNVTQTGKIMFLNTIFNHECHVPRRS